MIRINTQRLMDNLVSLGKIGATSEGGVTRTGLTPVEIKGRDWVQAQMVAAGLETWIDLSGSLHGLRRGKLVGAATVASGSHVDTVVNGGRFDGAAGIMAALEAVRAIDEAGLETDHPIEVLCLLAEEPSRFNVACYASRVLKGGIDEEMLDRVDPNNGKTLKETLHDLGIDADRFPEAKLTPDQCKVFIELHVELWNDLERMKVPVGIITDIVAPTRYRVVFNGVSSHPGMTPMGKRRDALVAASEAVIAIEKRAIDHRDKDIVGTVGVLDCKPNQINIIPGSVEIAFEVRGRHHFPKEVVVDLILKDIMEICKKRKIDLVFNCVQNDKAVKVPDMIIRIMQDASEKSGIDYVLMPSKAGHDAMHIAEVVPSGMIFVPSKGGLGHVPGEWTDPEDLAYGTLVLAESMVALAKSS